eukprot:scaffold105_cov151-Ochromonas_danica.AAC.1
MPQARQREGALLLLLLLLLGESYNPGESDGTASLHSSVPLQRESLHRHGADCRHLLSARLPRQPKVLSSPLSSLWHKDVFETETRKLRQRKSLKRRAVLREEWLEGKASDAAKEDCVVMEDSAGEAQAMICCRGRRAAGLRYAKVRQLWEGRVGEAQDCSWLTSTASANLS